MPYTQQQNKCITLQGSASMVRQFLHHGMNNVLYQRGVCPSGDFQQTKYHGLDLFTTKNSRHVDYFNRILGQIENFIVAKEVECVILVLQKRSTKEILERWEFKVDYETEGSNAKSSEVGKDPQTIRNEISAVIRQIIGAATILPLLDKDDVDFKINARRRPGVPQWPGWSSSTDSEILNKEQLNFRSFSTSVHSISTSVSYKAF